MELKKVKPEELEDIWRIFQYAIEQRRLDGSQQWQNGYPNPESLKEDIKNGYGYGVYDSDKIVGYAAIIQAEEPAYTIIEGKWLSDQEYIVVHRIAAGAEAKGKKMGHFFFQELETLALKRRIYSLRMDTNFDNAAMLRLLDKFGYTYCGQVYFSGSARRAFEKILN